MSLFGNLNHSKADLASSNLFFIIRKRGVSGTKYMIARRGEAKS